LSDETIEIWAEIVVVDHMEALAAAKLLERERNAGAAQAGRNRPHVDNRLGKGERHRR
jgi:hypothetical protein